MRLLRSVYCYFRPQQHVRFGQEIVSISESRELTNRNNIRNYTTDQRRKAHERFDKL